MSLTTEERMVQSDVHVIHCDGPVCNVEEVVPFKDNLRVPKGWYIAQQSHNLYATTASEEGVWHFHTLKCLVAWARLRAEREVMHAADQS